MIEDVISGLVLETFGRGASCPTVASRTSRCPVPTSPSTCRSWLARLRAVHALKSPGGGFVHRADWRVPCETSAKNMKMKRPTVQRRRAYVLEMQDDALWCHAAWPIPGSPLRRPSTARTAPRPGLAASPSTAGTRRATNKQITNKQMITNKQTTNSQGYPEPGPSRSSRSGGAPPQAVLPPLPFRPLLDPGRPCPALWTQNPQATSLCGNIWREMHSTDSNSEYKKEIIDSNL